MRASRVPGGAVVSIAVAGVLALTTFAVAAAQPGDDEARRIAHELQCPVCQGLSVADSPSELATQMRSLIREKLRAGESRDDIVRYFVDRYGESILMTPPRSGFTALIWIAPYVALALGAALLVSRLRRSRSTPVEPPAEPTTPADAPLDPFYEEVDRAVAQLRDHPLR